GSRLDLVRGGGGRASARRRAGRRRVRGTAMSGGNGSLSWGDVPAYHGQPVIKEPVWTWEIPCYFYSGGVAGASAGLAYLSHRQGNEVLARRSWAISLAPVI